MNYLYSLPANSAILRYAISCCTSSSPLATPAFADAACLALREFVHCNSLKVNLHNYLQLQIIWQKLTSVSAASFFHIASRPSGRLIGQMDTTTCLDDSARNVLISIVELEYNEGYESLLQIKHYHYVFYHLIQASMQTVEGFDKAYHKMQYHP